MFFVIVLTMVVSICASLYHHLLDFDHLLHKCSGYQEKAEWETQVHLVKVVFNKKCTVSKCPYQLNPYRFYTI